MVSSTSASTGAVPFVNNGHDSVTLFRPAHKFLLKDLFDVKPNLNSSWLIKSLLPANSLGVVYGAPGAGKSFLILDAALHVAAGRDWAGCKTKQAAVIYIVCEGQAGFYNRVATTRDKLEVPSSTRFKLIPVAPNLGTLKGDAQLLIDEIRAQWPKDWPPPDIIVIDTLSQTMFGADENGPDGMGAFIANAGHIRDELGSCVLSVHHKGKDQARGMRGWSGLHGACDFEWEVTEAEGRHSVTIPKMKDGPGGLSWGFSLNRIEIGKDQDGDPVTTCVVETHGKPTEKAASSARVTLKGKNALCLRSIKKAISEAGEIPPECNHIPSNTRCVTRENIRRYLKLDGWYDEGANEAARKRARDRAIVSLKEGRYIGEANGQIWMI